MPTPLPARRVLFSGDARHRRPDDRLTPPAEARPRDFTYGFIYDVQGGATGDPAQAGRPAAGCPCGLR